MPVMQGRTLRDLMVEQGQLPVETAVRLGSEIAGALDYAHRHDTVVGTPAYMRPEHSRDDSEAPPAADASVAVLRFSYMSADPDNEYFADGISDDVIVALTAVKGLRVAARTSSFAFKGKADLLAIIGRTLNVRTVLQGSVRRAGSRVRITVQLMHVEEGAQLWSERYDRELDDIFAIQDEIARSIVEQLRRALGLVAEHATVARPTDDLEAYQLYLRGREATWQRTPGSHRRT